MKHPSELNLSLTEKTINKHMKNFPQNHADLKSAD